MYIYVINLDSSEEKLAEFRRVNSHMRDIQRFSAVDGNTLDRQELLDRRMIEANLPYTNGALGCALSHIFFWEAATNENAEITICEDDAIFNKEFLDQAPELLFGE